MKKLILTVFVCLVALCNAESVFAQARGTASSWLGLLRMPTVQREIELVDDQRQQVEALQQDMWQEMREQMQELRGQEMDAAERRARYAELREQLEERQGDYISQIEEILLPDQVKRLKELHVQNQNRRFGEGAMGVLNNKELLEELGIDEETQVKLNEKAEVVMEKLEKKIKKLRKEAEEEILSVLSSEQRTKLRSMIGSSFDFGGGRGNRGRFGRSDRQGGGLSGRGGQEDKD